MVTLAFAQMAYFVVPRHQAGGGSDGIFLYAKPALRSARSTLSTRQAHAFYYVVIGGAGRAPTRLLALLLRSRFGHALAGIRVNEQRMRAAGFSTTATSSPPS